MLHQWLRAEKQLNQALRWNIELREKRFEAWDRLLLTTVYEATGRLQQAAQMAREAADLFERLGMTGAQAEAEGARRRYAEISTSPVDTTAPTDQTASV